MIGFLYSILLLFHPIHISVTEIEYNEKAKALQIITRIFMDDLESAVRNRIQQPELDILHPPKGLTTEALLSDYLKDHFKIKLDGKDQKMYFLGYEEEDFAFVCYIEIENVKDFKVAEVTNTVITDLYDDQSNLVHLTYKGPIRSTRLMRDKPSDKFTFE